VTDVSLLYGIAIGNEPAQFRSDEKSPQGGARQACTRKLELGSSSLSKFGTWKTSVASEMIFI
jgi:hypothetical protein